MADYIDREQAIEAAYQGLKRPNEDPKWVDIFENLKDVPSANVKPVVHGKWNYINGGVWRCSECGYFMGWKPRFCPNCGADMRGNDNERE